MRRLSILLLLALAALCLTAATASGSTRLRLGLTDSGGAYFDEDGDFFSMLAKTHASVLRVQLYWGGTRGVARTRPDQPLDPADPAYDWSDADRVVLAAHAEGTDVLFSIFGTPWWANGRKPTNRAPRNAADLWSFAYAAATRYSGTYEREDGVRLPAVRLWTAWNEPNLTLGLVPQWRRVGKRWIAQSAVDYARICTAVAEGVHATLLRGEKVACGVTAARGNNNPRVKRQSVSPLAFLRAMKKAGAHGFDAYAHHPYPGGPYETPSAKPKGPTAIGLGNIGTLSAEVTRLYGRLPIWITEYGYQTNPPDTIFGVSPKRQALYLRQSVAIAQANPRIDMLLWFLLRDEKRDAGWQSGLISVDGKLKPAFYAFERIAGVASPQASSSGTTALPPSSGP
jgi:hypothetical protein